ncbi:histone-like nucleoid-structuring protein Lsr2 [Arthrobacter sp. Ld5]|uniref:histone-like nucleoid-structuring protein Lsr2 n=1 Tax=Arthrobacter sp. Ld5 TaxID=649152 RepID=UPI003EB761A0
MAQKVNIILIDDIDGGEADETVRFGLDGVQYEIDLSEAHASELRSALSGYVDKARRGGQSKQRPGTSGGSSSRNQDAARIREWAKENGYNVSARGRVNSEIVEAYRAAQR